ncbi:hypothetical protein [Actinoplanes sp. NPDC049118]|uniref:hypothetical protein n=1 Tax=Actinoplanes sp. NPDC049118 TaxID=3155769 RepID=UPI0034099F1C
MTERYEIRVSDRLGPVLLGALAGMRSEVVPRQTIIEGWFSTEEFRALLLRVERVGVQLIRLDRVADERERRTRQDPSALPGPKTE